MGAGAILVNPWNISDMAASMEDALSMSEAERTERHRHNFMHVTSHTAQAWADTFVRYGMGREDGMGGRVGGAAAERGWGGRLSVS